MECENLAQHVEHLERERPEGEHRLRLLYASGGVGSLEAHDVEEALQNIDEELALADAALEQETAP